MWSEDLDQTLQFTDRTRTPSMGEQVSYKHSLSAAQELGHRLATLQYFGMDAEFQGTGRVLLSDFY